MYQEDLLLERKLIFHQEIRIRIMFSKFVGEYGISLFRKEFNSKAVLELVYSSGNDRIYYDHFVFHTFGVNGHGIDSLASIFLNFGFTQRDELLGFQLRN